MTDASRRAAAGIVHTHPAIEIALRLGLVALLLYWCLLILKPFIIPVLWGVIIAIGVYPAFRRLSALLGHRNKLAAVVFTLVGFALLITPTVFFAESAINGVQALAERWSAGTLIPPPPASVATWPVIGKSVHEIWQVASASAQEALLRVEPHVREYGSRVLDTAAGIGMVVVQFAIAILIAGVFLAKHEAGHRAADVVSTRLAGPRGAKLVDIAGATISSVVQGVLGVAVIQAVLAGAGMLVAGVPLAGLWAILVLVLAVVQLPPLLVLGPVILYVFSVDTTAPAVLFMIWSLLVSSSDMVLKPLFLGRGVDAPKLAILLGAIGGLLLHGIIGLFVGAVVLALTFNLYQAWLVEGEQAATTT